MLVTTIVGYVKNGQIQLSENIELPENTPVYVVIPSLKIKVEETPNPKLIDRELRENLGEKIED